MSESKPVYPTTTNPPKTYEGGCHCGAVRFRVVVVDPTAIRCNCSICNRKGFLHLIVPPEQFTLLRGADVLSTYTFNTGVAKHLFCKICGIHSFYRPRSHPESYDVNIHCLDGLEGEIRDHFQIQVFNGQRWEDNIDQIR
jgi:hypothetical protein